MSLIVKAYENWIGVVEVNLSDDKTLPRLNTIATEIV